MPFTGTVLGLRPNALPHKANDLQRDCCGMQRTGKLIHCHGIPLARRCFVLRARRSGLNSAGITISRNRSEVPPDDIGEHGANRALFGDRMTGPLP
jgi:hypothetical protein